MNEEQLEQLIAMLQHGGPEAVQGFVNMMRDFDEQYTKTLTFTGEDISLPTRAGEQPGLIYRPKNADGPVPLFIDVHGGGFVMGTPYMDDAFCQRVCDELGVLVVSLSYRLAPEAMYPADKDDVYDQVEYLFAHADEFGFDPQRVAIGGHSAGGNISTSLCLRYKQQGKMPFKVAIMDYPPLDLATNAFEKPTPLGCIHPAIADAFDKSYRDPAQGRDILLSPIYATEEELAGLPPHVFVTAAGDSLCGEAEEYMKHLMAAGVEVMGRRFHGVAHGFTMPSEQPPISDPETTARMMEEAIQLMIKGLKMYL